MDNETPQPYEPLLYRGGKIIKRKNVSLGDSGRYMRWIAETLTDSFDRKRRPSYRLLMELIPVLMEAAEKAELADGLQQNKEGSEEATQAFEKAKGEAFNSLLSGFGLIPPKGGATGSNENKSGRGRRPAASFWEVIKHMDELKNGGVSRLSTRKAAKQAAEAFGIGESTARRYWARYEESLSQIEE